jgi:hypothetical protein
LFAETHGPLPTLAYSIQHPDGTGIFHRRDAERKQRAKSTPESTDGAEDAEKFVGVAATTAFTTEAQSHGKAKAKAKPELTDGRRPRRGKAPGLSASTRVENRFSQRRRERGEGEGKGKIRARFPGVGDRIAGAQTRASAGGWAVGGFFGI